VPDYRGGPRWQALYAMRIAHRHLLVIATFLLSVLLYVDRACISAAKTPISRDLELTDQEMGWVLSAFALGYALCQTPAGMLADRFGPRWILTIIVTFWSAFTGLTGAVSGFISLVVTRFLFGIGEAGAFPSIARASYNWIPVREQGVVQGINFSGGRLGAALALPAVAAMIDAFGWRASFATLMVIGFAWAILWYVWFRDEPADHHGVGAEELKLIHATRHPRSTEKSAESSPQPRFARSNLWLLSGQYFASNFTFFFCLTWLFPHLKEKFSLGGVEAGFYAATPLIAGAVGNCVSGFLVDAIFRRGRWTASRRDPAMLGFTLAAVGLVGGAASDTAFSSIAWFSLAIFGADMTLAPSWSVCIDIGREHAGAVSGTMNMAGNLGSFVTALAFPYLAAWTESDRPFFYLAAGLNTAALFAWMSIDPRREAGECT